MGSARSRTVLVPRLAAAPAVRARAGAHAAHRSDPRMRPRGALGDRARPLGACLALAPAPSDAYRSFISPLRRETADNTLAF